MGPRFHPPGFRDGPFLHRFESPASHRATAPGLGDIYVGPFLQWDPVNLGCNGPLFMHRVELQFLLPTGKYSSDKEVNPGSNFFSFDPYWAWTLFITPKWEFSTRTHYLWNAKNNDPNRCYVNPDGTSSGQHTSRTGRPSKLRQFLRNHRKMLHAGVNGYYLKQTTDTQMDGNSVPGTKEQVLGIGPGFVFHFSQNSHFFVNVYFETAVEMRLRASDTTSASSIISDLLASRAERTGRETK